MIIGKRAHITGILFLVLGTLSTAEALFNRSVFFRTSSFWDEPRLVKPYLSTFEIQLLGGSNHKGRRCTGKTTNILSIYGPENVQGLSSANPDHPLILPNTPQTISFQAVADVFEANFNLSQNFCHGFFTHFHLPVVLLQLYPSGYLADSCRSARASKHYKPVWQQTLQPINKFLKPFDLALCSTHQAGLSDSTLFLGWTTSYEDTCRLDYIDFTLQTGLLLPTGKKKSINQPFDIAYGYNGHWAFPLMADISFGLFDWFTFGIHADSLFFLKKEQCIRMKAAHQASTGFIRLGKGQATVEPGIVWRAGTYLKADHFFNGLSLLLGFSYEQQNRTKLIPRNQKLFPCAFVNNDEQLKKWARTVVHFLVEYDFTTEESCLGPRIGFFYDRQITGQRVFDIHTVGGYCGLDVSWCY